MWLFHLCRYLGGKQDRSGGGLRAAPGAQGASSGESEAGTGGKAAL